MFITTQDCYEELSSWLKSKPKKVQISTFGIYAGILETGKSMHKIGGKYTSQTHLFLDQLKDKGIPVDILVGIAQYRSCKGKEHCEDCYVAYGKQIMRLLKHAENWPQFTWRFKDELHLKCMIFHSVKRTRILGGGRNLTDSDWADVSFELPSEIIEETEQYFNKQWKESVLVTEENLLNYVTTSFEKQFSIKK